MAKLVAALEGTAGAFLALVTALTFVAVICRYVFNWPIPDSFDLENLSLGIVVFWGIAAAGYRNEHIKMDVLWTMASARWRRVIDLFAHSVTLLALIALAWAGFTKLLQTVRSGEQTFDLRLPLWPFYALAWLGLLTAVFLLALRLREIFVGKAQLQPGEPTRT